MKDSQRGIVSFFTVIFISILLIIMTTAFIRLMVNEQRQSIDNDLSSRALYAAEAGVDDAIVQLKAAIENGTLSSIPTKQCNSKTLNTQYSISYTCQFISLDTNQLSGELKEGETLELDLVSMPNVERMQLKWHVPQDDNKMSSLNTFAGYSPGVGENIAPALWKNRNTPAIMRFEAVRYEEGSSFGMNTIDHNASFAYPANNSSSTATIPISSSKSNAGCQPLASTVSDNFACQVIFTGLGTKANKFLRLRTVNNKAHYEVQLFGATGTTPITIPNQVAVIDVTGKAGNDVFRRIRVFVPLKSTNSSNGKVVPDQALLVDTEICKDFEISKVEGAVDVFNCTGDPDNTSPGI